MGEQSPGEFLKEFFEDFDVGIRTAWVELQAKRADRRNRLPSKEALISDLLNMQSGIAHSAHREATYIADEYWKEAVQYMGEATVVALPREGWDHVIHSLEENIDQLHGGPDDEPLHDEIESLQLTLEMVMEQVVDGDTPEREADIKVWVKAEKQTTDKRALFNWVTDNHPTVEHVEASDALKEALDDDA